MLVAGGHDDGAGIPGWPQCHGLIPTKCVSLRAQLYVALAQPASAASQSPWHGGLAPSRVVAEQQKRSANAALEPFEHEYAGGTNSTRWCGAMIGYRRSR